MADSFKLQMGRILRKVDGRANTLLRATALETLSRIVQRTPVDTGRARGGWEVAIDATPPDSSDVDASGGATIARAAAVITGAKAGSSIVIRNSVPYINMLEYGGHSPQAPAGMVRITVQEIRSIVDRAAAKAKREG